MRQALDRSQDQVANEGGGWWSTFFKVAVQEGAYQTLDQISFGALSRQDKIVDQNIAGEISDAEYHARTGVNVVIAGAEAAVTIGTGGAGRPAATVGRAAVKGVVGGVVGQAAADTAEIVGTGTKTLDDVSATDYLFNASLGALSSGLELRARRRRPSAPSPEGRGADALVIGESRNASRTVGQPATSRPRTDLSQASETLDDSLRMVEQPLRPAGRGSTYRARFNQTPRSGGWWSGARGESTFFPYDSSAVFRGGGVEFRNARPDFGPFSRANVTIEGMSTNRMRNFSRADQALADQMGISKSDARSLRREGNFTWHEMEDKATMQLVPRRVNDIGHLGGVGEIKAEEAFDRFRQKR